MAEANYYRGDQRAGITAPDLADQCEISEHIVRARGKRTRYTSVSLDKHAISRFGECDYLLLRDLLSADSHALIEYPELVQQLEEIAKARDKGERLMAIRALHYTRQRKEGLVRWCFKTDAVERKDLITWAFAKVQQYFRRC